MKSTWLISSICLASIAVACSSDSSDGGDETAGTGGSSAGTSGTTNGGTSGAGVGGSGGHSGSGTGGISFGGNATGGSGGSGGHGGTGGSTGGTGGTGGAGGHAGTGGSGGGGNAGDPCSHTTWTATASSYCGQTGACADPNGPFPPSNAIDGSATTHFSTGKKQDGTEQITVTFPANVMISGVTLTVAAAGDAPAMYEAQFSTDGTTFTSFTPAVTGVGAATTNITFAATTMKAVRIKQTGMYAANVTAWWSINEITVTGCARAN